MKTVNIKGKEYVEVNERVKHFIKKYVGWSITTEMLSNADGICVFKATIKDENDRVMATGHAYEKESSSYINKTSFIENCETSAVGRALGFLGIGIDASIASSDEVINAMNNQQEAKKAMPKNQQVKKFSIRDIGVAKKQLELAKSMDELKVIFGTLGEIKTSPEVIAKKDEMKKMFEEGRNGVE